MSKPSISVSNFAKVVLAFLVIGHVVLGFLYSGVTPYREAGYINRKSLVQDYGAPDERQHANYVQRFISGQGVAVFNPKDPNLYETYQAHQPPLFYILDSIWCKVIGVADTTQPSARLARGLNSLLGGITVAGVFFLGLWGFKREDVGLTAAALTAGLPMFAALSGAISNDPLLICLCTWVLALTGKLHEEGWTVKGMILAGLLTALALYTKSTAIALLPTLFVGWWLGKRAKVQGDTLVLGAIAIAVLLVLPWWVRNTTLYGDPLAMKAFKEAFGNSAKTEDMIAQFGAQEYWIKYFGWWTMRSFIGVFGYMDIFMNQSGTPYVGPKDPNVLYLGVLLVLFTGWLLGLRSLLQSPKESRSVWILVPAVFLVLVKLLFLSFNLTYFQAQARYLYPAIGPISILFGFGVCSIGKAFADKWSLVVAGLLIVLNVLVLGRLPEEFAKRSALNNELNQVQQTSSQQP